MKSPCSKAEWPKSPPTCGGDWRSARQGRLEGARGIASGWPGFPHLQLPATSLDAVQSLSVGAIAK